MLPIGVVGTAQRPQPGLALWFSAILKVEVIGRPVHNEMIDKRIGRDVLANVITNH